MSRWGDEIQLSLVFTASRAAATFSAVSAGTFE